MADAGVRVVKGLVGSNSISAAHIRRRVPTFAEPDWSQLLLDLRARGVTAKSLALLMDIDGSTLRWLIRGTARKGKTRRPRWLVGQIIIAAHKEFCK